MGHKRVVHVIDDESDVCEALKVLLHTAGMEARTYASAEEFLAEVRLTKPICLLVDVRLPGMSGLELVRQLQLGPVRPVVVVITGHGDVPLALTAEGTNRLGARWPGAAREGRDARQPVMGRPLPGSPRDQGIAPDVTTTRSCEHQPIEL